MTDLIIKYLFIATEILFFLSGMFAVTKQFQMLQQNSYFPSRYLGWLKDSGKKSFFASAVFFVILSVLFNPKGIIIVLPVSFVYFSVSLIKCFLTQKKSIKKLVFTARVRRLYYCAAAVFSLICLLYIVTDVYYFAALSMLLGVLPQLLVFIVWAIMKPFENKITKHYINDAKSILKSYGDGLKVIGITGSYGKTGTKFILNRILSEKYNVTATPGSFNTPMGVVRTVRENLRPETEVFLCEMGAKNIGDIKEICDIALPQSGIITSVGPQHLETFKTTDNVLKTKFELADSVNANGGKIYLNGDNELIMQRSMQNDCIFYGTNPDFPFYAENFTFNADGVSFDLHLRNECINVTAKLLGMHNILNITGAAAIAYDMGVSKENIKFAVSRLEPTAHRLELKSFTNGSALIDDAYNANPEGSIEAVNVLSRFDKKKVIVTPGLVELGEKEYEYNYNLGAAAAEKCDVIILVGKQRSKPMADAVNKSKFNKDNLFVVESFKAAMDIYNRIADKNTVVLFENDLPDNYIK